MNDSIVVSRQNYLIELTFNRPDKLNSFTHQMCSQLEKVCQEINKDQMIRAVLMRGNGEAFMGGTDLYELYRNIDSISAEALSIIRRFNACILMLREMDKLVVSCVHGLVSGVGMSLMLASDLVIASDNAKFCLGYNQFAISPAGASSHLLPRIVGAKKALELLVMSEIFDVKQAKALGLLNWIIPHDQLASETKKITDHIINGPIIAFIQTKHLLNSAWQNKLTSQLELEAEAFIKCVNTKDFKSAVRSFVNKGIPEFEGR